MHGERGEIDTDAIRQDEMTAQDLAIGGILEHEIGIVGIEERDRRLANRNVGKGAHEGEGLRPVQIAHLQTEDRPPRTENCHIGYDVHSCLPP